MAWRKVYEAGPAEDVSKIEVEADGSVNITTPSGVFLLRPDGAGLTVRLDGRPDVLTVIPVANNAIVLKPLRSY